MYLERLLVSVQSPVVAEKLSQSLVNLVAGSRALVNLVAGNLLQGKSYLSAQRKGKLVAVSQDVVVFRRALLERFVINQLEENVLQSVDLVALEVQLVDA